MRSLIIGATSFSGRYMCEFLQSKGEEFVGTALSLREELADKTAGRLTEMDLLDLPTLVQVLKEVQPAYIFNFAAQSSVELAWKNPGMTVEVNVNGALNLFQAIRQAQIDPTVILIGAGEEYGRVDFQQLPTSEAQRLAPGNIYAATKACQTMMAQIYHKAYGLKLIVARTFNIIGPGQSDHFAVSNFCHQAALIEKGAVEPVLHVGNMNIERDFTDIRDVVRAYWMLAEKGVPGEVYNVGRGEAMAIRTVVEQIQKQLGARFSLQVDRDRMRPVDTPKIQSSIQKIRDDVGWEPEISMEKTVQDMLNYWRAK